MLILGINGSPNRDGNTAFLLKAALAEAARQGAKVQEIFITEIMAEQKPPFCTACSSPCNGICYLGTSLGETHKLMSAADGIFLGSPVYFGTVSAQLKGFWDKTRILRQQKALLNTVGGVITVGAASFGGQETTAKALIDMMLVQGMTVVGDGFIEDDSGHHGAFAQQPSEKDSQALKRVKILAKRVLEVACSTQSLRSSTV